MPPLGGRTKLTPSTNENNDLDWTGLPELPRLRVQPGASSLFCFFLFSQSYDLLIDARHHDGWCTIKVINNKVTLSQISVISLSPRVWAARVRAISLQLISPTTENKQPSDTRSLRPIIFLGLCRAQRRNDDGRPSTSSLESCFLKSSSVVPTTINYNARPLLRLFDSVDFLRAAEVRCTRSGN